MAECPWILTGLPPPKTSCLPSFRFNFQDETPTTNFDTFPAAILTVFQVKLLVCLALQVLGRQPSLSAPCAGASARPERPTFQTELSKKQKRTSGR